MSKNKLFQCLFCKYSFFSNKDRLEHQKICPNNNNLTAEEKFRNRLKLNKNTAKGQNRLEVFSNVNSV